MNPKLGLDFGSAYVSYRWECAKCGKSEVRVHPIRRGEEIIHAAMPAGWTQLDHGRFVCPNHTVVTLVDGVPLGN